MLTYGKLPISLSDCGAFLKAGACHVDIGSGFGCEYHAGNFMWNSFKTVYMWIYARKSVLRDHLR